MIDLKKPTGFAVDLGGTKTAVARIVNGSIINRLSVRTDGQALPDTYVETMGSMLADIGYQHGDNLGVAITGRVDASGVWHAVNLSTLTEVAAIPIAALIRERIGPANVMNDAAAATLAEAKCGAGREYQNFGYITASTGIGGGLFLGGRLHQSANGFAGHVGFTSSPLGKQMCGSGRFGTVESVAAGRAIAQAALASGYPDLDAKQVFERAGRGEKWAEDIVENSALAVTELCADLTIALGLEAIILAGSIGLADGYIDRVVQHFSKLPKDLRPILNSSTLGHEGPLLGALFDQTGQR